MLPSEQFSAEFKKIGRRADVPDRDWQNLAAAVRVTGEIDRYFIDRVQATVEFLGQEVPHEPSGNLVYDLRIHRIQLVRGTSNPETYIFLGGHLPGAVLVLAA